MDEKVQFIQWDEPNGKIDCFQVQWTEVMTVYCRIKIHFDCSHSIGVQIPERLNGFVWNGWDFFSMRNDAVNNGNELVIRNISRKVFMFEFQRTQYTQLSHQFFIVYGFLHLISARLDDFLSHVSRGNGDSKLLEDFNGFFPDSK